MSNTKKKLLDNARSWGKFSSNFWIEINCRYLKENFHRIKSIVGEKVKILGVVKQNAYGCGIYPVSYVLEKEGIDYLGVSNLEEAIFLRKKNIKTPILHLGQVSPPEAELLIKYRITPTIYELSLPRRLNRLAIDKSLIFPVHIKIDTGMRRLGIRSEEAINFIKKLRKFRHLCLEGCYSHFPAAENNQKFTRKQIAIFNSLIEKLNKENINLKYFHIANSAGILNFPQSYFNMVRPGILLYGASKGDSFFKNVFSLKTRVIFLKKVNKQEAIGYGLSFSSPRDTTIAVLGIGYACGYPYSLSNKGKVIINKRFYPVVGKVCMDYTLVDVGCSHNIKIGDVATLIGEEGKLSISPVEVANWAGSISYEVLSRFPSDIPRVYKYFP